MLLCGFELLFLGFAGATALGAKSIHTLSQEGDNQPSYGEPPYGTPPQHLMPQPHRAQRMGQEVYIKQNGKAFIATCRIADVPFMAMIDTGATDCIISHKVVRALGQDPGRLRANKTYSMANGKSVPATLMPLPIEVQGIPMENVNVAIIHGSPGDNLIGMSFLDRLSSYEKRGNTMILRP
jgi:aspartyl protease family protein